MGDAPVCQQHDAVGERERLVDVVGDQQDRRAVPLPQVEHELMHRQSG